MKKFILSFTINSFYVSIVNGKINEVKEEIHMKQNIKWKSYEIIALIISIIFLILASLNLLDVTTFNENIQSLFYSIFLLGMFVVTVRKSTIVSILFLVAGILFFISIL